MGTVEMYGRTIDVMGLIDSIQAQGKQDNKTIDYLIKLLQHEKSSENDEPPSQKDCDIYDHFYDLHSLIGDVKYLNHMFFCLWQFHFSDGTEPFRPKELANTAEFLQRLYVERVEKLDAMYDTLYDTYKIERRASQKGVVA